MNAPNAIASMDDPLSSINLNLKCVSPALFAKVIRMNGIANLGPGAPAPKGPTFSSCSKNSTVIEGNAKAPSNFKFFVLNLPAP